MSGRKTKTVTITVEGRDRGKVFVLCEMTARQAEEWGWRAMEAIAQHNNVPPGLMNAGMLGVFILGLKPVFAAPFTMVKPLLDEMFDRCLSIQPDQNNPGTLRGAGTNLIKPVGPLIDEDMEEVATRIFLRDEIFELHTGFSPAAILSQMWEKVMVVASSLSTPTSRAASEPSSLGALN